MALDKVRARSSAIVVALVVSTACKPHSASLPIELVIPGSATEVTSRAEEGAAAVGFTIHEAYPAEKFLSEARSVLGSRGWKPMETDWLNPSVRSSHVRGWASFKDRRERPATVHQWIGQWQNSAGDLVTYSLEYRSASELGPGEPPTTDLVKVSEAFVPHAMAQAMRDQVVREAAEARDVNITVGSDENMSGNAFGRNVSASFRRPELERLHAWLNSAEFRVAAGKYSCAKPLPEFEVSVQLWEEGKFRERQVRMQTTPRVYRDDGCLRDGIGFLFERAVKSLDTGPPIDYGYRNPRTGAKLDTSGFAKQLPPEPQCECPEPAKHP